jgi:putative sterol carrier protein
VVASTAEEPQTPPLPPFPELLAKVAAKLEGKHLGKERTIQFDLGEGGVHRLILAADGSCRAEQGEGPATATLKMRAEDAAKLLSGQLNPMIALATGKIKTKGDVRALMVLQGLR